MDLLTNRMRLRGKYTTRGKARIAVVVLFPDYQPQLSNNRLPVQESTSSCYRSGANSNVCVAKKSGSLHVSTALGLFRSAIRRSMRCSLASRPLVRSSCNESLFDVFSSPFGCVLVARCASFCTILDSTKKSPGAQFAVYSRKRSISHEVRHDV
jgi:hypothetical protein